MASRNFPDWLDAYIQYADIGEAPRRMHFWCGVSAVAGALRRKVWIDQKHFKWFPNFYIVFVAKPGIVAKTTTMDIGMDLLKELPGIKFGPSVVTWQSLVKSFAESQEQFDLNGEYQTMAAMTLASGEFGNLLNPQDREMIDMFVSLWDGKGFKKETKTSGKDEVVNPWINMIACTTPAWIAQNFPEYIIGGGFTSRCVFVFAAEKARYVAYPKLHVPPDFEDLKSKLIMDLDQIARLRGEYELTKEAYAWGIDWYDTHWKSKQGALDEERLQGYMARKQTHIHKLAMILAAAESDRLFITQKHLERSWSMVTDLEGEMANVFSKIGMTEEGVAAGRLLDYIKRHGRTKYSEAYRFIYAQFPGIRSFEDILKGLIQSKQLNYEQIVSPSGTDIWLSYVDQEGEKR